MLVKTIFAAIATASFGILFNIRGANLILAGVNGGIGYLVFTVSVVRGFETYIGMFYASLLMTAIAEILARYRKAPASIFLAAALIPIVPGGRLFNVVMNLLEGDYQLAGADGVTALLEAGAIAIGIIATSSLTKVVLTRLQPRKNH